jgi:hypothetical protein
MWQNVAFFMSEEWGAKKNVRFWPIFGQVSGEQ